MSLKKKSLKLWKESFIEKGGVNFDLIPCLNDNSDHIKLFEKLIGKYL